LEMQSLAATSRALEKRVLERTAELATAHANNERLLATISSVLTVLDPCGRVSKWNKTAEAVFGLSASQGVGQPFCSLPIHWADGEVIERLLDAGRRNQETRAEKIAYTRPGGQSGYLNLCITPILGQPEEDSSGLLVLGEDRTEQHFMELQLAQAQKLESIGQLAAGIAHEINTPIQYIGDNTHFLRESLLDLQPFFQACRGLCPAPRERDVTADQARELGSLVAKTDLGYLSEEMPRAIEQILEGVEHVARIVRAMKEFSHPGGEEKAAVDLNQ